MEGERRAVRREKERYDRQKTRERHKQLERENSLKTNSVATFQSREKERRWRGEVTFVVIVIVWWNAVLHIENWYIILALSLLAAII